MASAEVRRDGRLRDGMVIVGSIRARLLGFQLLQLNADVTITPASRRLKEGRAQSRQRALPATNGSIGGDLGVAARALESTAGELTAARRRMP